LIEKWLIAGSEALDKNELTEVMYSSQGMLQMHRSVWSRPFEKLHSSWSRAIESYRTRIDEYTLSDR